MQPIPFGKPIISKEERNAVLKVLDGPIHVHGPVAKQFGQTLPVLLKPQRPSAFPLAQQEYT